MLVCHSFDHRFVQLMERLKKVYGEEFFNLTGIGDQQLDINKYSKNFFKNFDSTSDKTIDGNANVDDKSVNAWETELKKPIMKLNALYQLWSTAEVKHGVKRANKLIEHEIRGAIRIHDCHLWNKSYCFAYSLTNLVHFGMPFYNKIKIGPVKHFNSFINLSLQFLCYASNQIAGACAFPDFFVYAEYFIRKDYGEQWYNDEKVIGQINQLFQNWIYSVNFSWRSNQSPFTNLSIFDRPWLESLFSNHFNPDGSSVDFDNVDRVQKLFVNEMVRNLEDNPYTFPILTSCMLYDQESGKYVDDNFFNWVSEIQSKTALFNMFQDDNINALSSCCRLRNSLDINKEYVNSFGVGGLSIGSHRVVSLNLPQIAYQSESWDDFMKMLDYRINIAHDVLDIHRETIEKHIDNDRLPLYKHGYMELSKQFSTIGFIGMYECLEIMGWDITSDVGKNKAKEILDYINKVNERKTKQDNHIRNVEQIPGESAGVNFAKKDKILFENSKNVYSIYSNQYVPLVKNVDINDRITMQGLYDKECGGGSIMHINLANTLTVEQFKQVMEYTASKGVIYWAINYGLSQCSNCDKVFVGKYDLSPCHSAETKKFLRVVGFLSEVDNWIKERRKEYKTRQFYDEI